MISPAIVRRLPRRVVVALLVTTTLLTSGSALFLRRRSDSPIVALVPNKSYKRAIQRAEKQRFTIQLGSDQYARIEASQFEIDIRLAILAPDHKPLVEMNGSGYGFEVASIVAPASGIYEVVVQALADSTNQGHFEIRIAELRSSRNGDAKELMGHASFQASTRQPNTKEGLTEAKRLAAEAAERWTGAPDLVRSGQAQVSVAALSARTAEWDLASESYKRAAELFRQARDEPQRLNALRGLARLSGQFGIKGQEIPSDEEFLQLWEDVGDRRGIADAIGSLGGQALRAGNVAEALKLRRKALEMRQGIGDVEGTIRSLEGILSIHTGNKEYDAAFLIGKQILRQREVAGTKRDQASALSALALLCDRTGRMTEAVSHLRRVVAIHHDVGDVSAEQDMRRYLGLLLGLSGHTDEGLRELYHSKKLQDQIEQYSASPAWKSGYAANHAWASSLIRVLQTAHRSAPSMGYDKKAFAAADNALGQYVLQGTESASEARLEDVQLVLDSDSILLEYWTDGENVWVWCVTREAESIHVLPYGQEILDLSRKAYESLTLRSSDLRNWPMDEIRRRLAASDREASAAIAELSRKLLGPISGELKRKQILIVGNGLIQRVPFALLPDPSVSDHSPLLARHEVVYLPSAATALIAAKRQPQGLQASSRVTIIADPVANHQTTSASADLVRAVRSVGMSEGSLPRLLYARREAQDIARSAQANQVTQLLGPAATRDAVLDSTMADSRIIHFATHGFANPSDPESSGLLLSPGHSHKDDGFLRLRDIQDMRLSAQLVVLSACRTARGAEPLDGGVISLSSGFLRAGASKVLSTAWKVDDEATAAFMKTFYEKYLGEGLSAATSLRQAQLELAATERWKAPYYWGGFVLHEGWR